MELAGRLLGTPLLLQGFKFHENGHRNRRRRCRRHHHHRYPSFMLEQRKALRETTSLAHLLDVSCRLASQSLPFLDVISMKASHST